MYNLVGVEYLESVEDVEGHGPDEVFLYFLAFFYLLFDDCLHGGIGTARSPPLAYSMMMQRVLPSYSKKAVL
jgi:hypothetical protein